MTVDPWDTLGMVGAPGQCILRREIVGVDGGNIWVTHLDESLVIERADPKIWVSCEFLAEIEAGMPTRADGRPYAELDGDLLRINADNRTVVYRLGEHHFELDVYEAEWPD